MKLSVSGVHGDIYALCVCVCVCVCVYYMYIYLNDACMSHL